MSSPGLIGPKESGSSGANNNRRVEMYEESITEAIETFKNDEQSIQLLIEKIEEYAYALLRANEFTPEAYETLYIAHRVIKKIKGSNGAGTFESVKSEILDYIENIRRPKPNNEKVKTAIRELIDDSQLNELEFRLLTMAINIAYQKAFVRLGEISKQVKTERHMTFDHLRQTEINPDLWLLLAVLGPQKFAETMMLMEGKSISFPTVKKMQDAEMARKLKASKKSDQKISNEELAKLFDVEPHRVKYLLSQKNGLTDLYEDERVMSSVFNRILKLELYEELQKKKK